MWRNRTILLCRGGVTRDGNVDRIGQEILAGFRACGWTAEEVLLPPGDPAPVLAATMARIEAGAFDLVLSVQDLGLLGPEADPILKRGGARRLYWALDHPFSAWQSVANLPANAVLTYPTRGFIDCCRARLRFDLNAQCAAHASALREAKPWRERTIGALFVGNAPSVPTSILRENWPKAYPPVWAGVLEDMAARFDVSRSESLHGLADAAFEARGADPKSIRREDFMLLLSIFDAYAWARVRTEYVNALRGAPVTLVGRGWDDWAGGDTKVLGPMPTDKARALMDEAKLVLNLLPAWYRSHERIFEGMAAGCAVATTGREILANASAGAADDGRIVTLGAPMEARKQIAELLADDAKLTGLAEAGRSEQRAHHTWEHRVAALLALIEHT